MFLPSRCPEELDRHIAALDPTQLAQSCAQGIHIGRGLVRPPNAEPRDTPHAADPLLRERRERPRSRRAGERSYAFSPSNVDCLPSAAQAAGFESPSLRKALGAR